MPVNQFMKFGLSLQQISFHSFLKWTGKVINCFLLILIPISTSSNDLELSCALSVEGNLEVNPFQFMSPSVWRNGTSKMKSCQSIYRDLNQRNLKSDLYKVNVTSFMRICKMLWPYVSVSSGNHSPLCYSCSVSSWVPIPKWNEVVCLCVVCSYPQWTGKDFINNIGVFSSPYTDWYPLLYWSAYTTCPPSAHRHFS